MTKDTGGSAFPKVSYQKPDGYGAHIMIVEGGMTLRDYFAARAMQGWISNSPQIGGNVLNGSDGHAESIASISYAWADAMIAERNK